MAELVNLRVALVVGDESISCYTLVTFAVTDAMVQDCGLVMPVKVVQEIGRNTSDRSMSNSVVTRSQTSSKTLHAVNSANECLDDNSNNLRGKHNNSVDKSTNTNLNVGRPSLLSEGTVPTQLTRERIVNVRRTLHLRCQNVAENVGRT